MSESNKVLAIILGDGHIAKRKSSRLTITHSTKQREWLMYKVGILQESGFKMRVDEREMVSFGKGRSYLIASSTSTARVKSLRGLFYPNGVKSVPEQCLEFGFEEWSILYQDDGRQNTLSHYNVVKNGTRVRIECPPFVNRYEIYKNAFSDRDYDILRTSLKNLGVETSLLNLRQGGRSLVISRSSSKAAFFDGVSPYIIPSMEYKVSALPALSYIKP